jgi:hypothetical protein
MRKQILSNEPRLATPPSRGELDVAGIATALVSSEAAGHPIENAFDAQRGPGGSRWVAGCDGEQTLILEFDTPQTLRQVALEVEETEVSRTQELQLSVSADGGKTYREIVRQEFNFSPSGTTFEREEWTTNAEATTHLRLQIKPDKGDRPCRASVTSLVLR